MTEKIYTTKKLGMPMLLVIILGLIAATGMILFGFIGEVSGALGALGILLWIILPICIGGLKVLKPQEALVLTLFGKYKGTLKGEGFYFVNPFCTAINPAQFTQLGQSGDIAGSGGLLGALTKGNSGKETTAEFDAQMRASKKISLKVMTLSNSKQKVNDALGNCPSRRIPQSGASRRSIPMTSRRTSTPPVTAKRTTAPSAVPPNWWRPASRRRSRRRSRPPVSRSSTPASRTWPTRRRSPRSCCRDSRLPP